MQETTGEMGVQRKYVDGIERGIPGALIVDTNENRSSWYI